MEKKKMEKKKKRTENIIRNVANRMKKKDARIKSIKKKTA